VLDRSAATPITYSKAPRIPRAATRGVTCASKITISVCRSSVISWKWEPRRRHLACRQDRSSSRVVADHQIYNSAGRAAARFRSRRTKPRCYDCTLSVYADDDDETARDSAANKRTWSQCPGYISMEDGAVVSFIQRGIAATRQAQSVIRTRGYDVARGGKHGVRATETSVRGFWNGYRGLMGLRGMIRGRHARSARIIEDLHVRYVRCIDDDRLEAWPELFTDPCRIRSRRAENVTRQISPFGLLECTSTGMLLRPHRGAAPRERLRAADVFRTIISALEVYSREDGSFAARSNYLVIRHDGRKADTMLFSAGVYADIIEIAGDARRVSAETQL